MDDYLDDLEVEHILETHEAGLPWYRRQIDFTFGRAVTAATLIAGSIAHTYGYPEDFIGPAALILGVPLGFVTSQIDGIVRGHRNYNRVRNFLSPYELSLSEDSPGELERNLF